jgi:hypothetical protein
MASISRRLAKRIAKDRKTTRAMGRELGYDITPQTYTAKAPGAPGFSDPGNLARAIRRTPRLAARLHHLWRDHGPKTPKGSPSVTAPLAR